MAASHSQRADELATLANQALEEALAACSQRHAIRSESNDVAALAGWAKVRALQAQAQIHATLALNETLEHRG